MELKRNNIIYFLAKHCTDSLISLYHNIHYQGIENLPRTSPALLMPKHQAFRDILVEGYILNKTIRMPANWVMKYSLPKPLESMGGIRVVRKKDIKSQKTKNKRKALIKKARDMNSFATEYMKWLYANEEIVIVHPEGTRNSQKMGVIRDNEFNLALNLLRQTEEEYHITIPIIPIGIHYQSLRPRSRVDVKIGKPLYSNQKGLMNIVHSEIASLSGF